jgi:hypothetical protein
MCHRRIRDVDGRSGAGFGGSSVYLASPTNKSSEIPINTSKTVRETTFHVLLLALNAIPDS